MTKNEQELLTIIRENKSPERAFITAVLIIGRAVELFESYPIPFADSQQEHA